jgi:hypothetical protein
MVGLSRPEEDGSRFARMPNHAMRLHEWGTHMDFILCMGHPPVEDWKEIRGVDDMGNRTRPRDNPPRQD